MDARPYFDGSSPPPPDTIATARVGGRGSTALTRPSYGPGDNSAAWSPGGRRVAFCRNISLPSGGGPKQAMIVAAAGGRPERLRGGCSSLDWSSTGPLAIADERGLVVREGGRERRLVTANGVGGGVQGRSPTRGRTVSWSPDARTIAYKKGPELRHDR